MRQVTEIKTIYKFGENAEIDEKIRENFHQDNHFDYFLHERIDTLKALAKSVYGELDYSISVVPDRGEFIKITDFDKDYLKELIDKKDDCPLTGMCYDYAILSLLEENESMQDALDIYLTHIHAEYDTLMEHENLLETCEANEYEFDENGNIY